MKNLITIIIVFIFFTTSTITTGTHGTGTGTRNMVQMIHNSTENEIILSVPVPVVIRCYYNDTMVLNGEEKELVIKKYAEDPYENWYLQYFGDGMFIIFNQGNGRYLVLEEAEDGAPVITKLYNEIGKDDESKFWYLNSDHSVKNGATDMVMEIENGVYESGSRVVMRSADLSDKQKFRFIYRNIVQ